jgi:hypothetical protein
MSSLARRISESAKLVRDFAAGLTLGAPQDDAGPLSQAVVGLAAFGPEEKLGSILCSNRQNGFAGTAAWHDVDVIVRADRDPVIIT